MQKLFILILTTSILSLVMCSSSESPEASFEKFKQAACQKNTEEFLSRIDFNSLAISNFKEKNPQATDAEIQAYVTSQKYNEDLNKFKENIKKLITENDNELCKFTLIKTTTNGDVATLNVQENPDNPYLIYKYTFRKSGNKWLWASVEGLDNPPLAISSADLYEEYKSNEIAADQKYKGKTVQITGKINQIGKDIANQVYFTIGSGIMGDVQCIIKKSHIDKVASLKPGQEIEVTGVCDGKVMIVELKECVF